MLFACDLALATGVLLVLQVGKFQPLSGPSVAEVVTTSAILGDMLVARRGMLAYLTNLIIMRFTLVRRARMRTRNKELGAVFASFRKALTSIFEILSTPAKTVPDPYFYRVCVFGEI